jgi:hypothetical protein
MFLSADRIPPSGQARGHASPEHALTCLGGQIMRYFNVLGRNDQARGGSRGGFSAFADRVRRKTLLGKTHSAKVDTGFA